MSLYWHSMLLGLVVMIGVTSGIAFAADAPPSVTPNSGLVAPAAADAPASPAPPAPPAAAPEPSPVLAAPQPVAPAPEAVDRISPAPLPAAESQSIVGKWWFWTAIGAAVVGGVVAIYLVERAPALPGCPTTMGYVCPR
jgi:hypothetical protein